MARTVYWSVTEEWKLEMLENPHDDILTEIKFFPRSKIYVHFRVKKFYLYDITKHII